MSQIDPQKAHYITATAIIVKDGKYLIAKRADWEKAFPGLWTVPGGKLTTNDYQSRPRDTADCWYNVLEDLIAREVLEETDLKIKNLSYVTSMVFARPDSVPGLIISLSADWASGEVKLSNELSDHAWVNLEEAKSYDLIEGIYQEIEILDAKLKGHAASAWQKS